MTRTHNSRLGSLKEFNNGNINIKFDLKMLYKNESDIVQLLWLLDDFDTYNIGDEFCLSNYDMGCLLYNCYSDLTYILSFSELSDAFKTGKTLKLYARKPDEYDRQEIERYFNS